MIATSTAIRTDGNDTLRARPGDGTEALREAGAFDDDRAHDATDRPRQEPGEQQIAGEAPAPPEQRRAEDEADGPQRAEAVERPGQGEQAVGQGVEEVEDRPFGGGDGPGVAYRDDQEPGGDHESHAVAGAAPGGPVGAGAEGAATEALGQAQA